MFIFYLQLTKQLTCLQIKNRYLELIRVSRQMRKLQVSKRFGDIYSNILLLEVLHSSAPLVPSQESIYLLTGRISQAGLLIEPLQWMAIFMPITSRCVDLISTSG